MSQPQECHPSMESHSLPSSRYSSFFSSCKALCKEWEGRASFICAETHQITAFSVYWTCSNVAVHRDIMYFGDNGRGEAIRGRPEL